MSRVPLSIVHRRCLGSNTCKNEAKQGDDSSITKKQYEYELLSMSIECNETIFTAVFGVLGSWRANHTGTLQRDG